MASFQAKTGRKRLRERKGLEKENKNSIMASF